MEEKEKKEGGKAPPEAQDKGQILKEAISKGPTPPPDGAKDEPPTIEQPGAENAASLESGANDAPLEPDMNDEKLPCGLIRDGKRYQNYSIIKFTGLVRKQIAQPNVRRNGGKAVTVLLQHCLTDIGGFGKPKDEVLKSLSAADRDVLALKIRELSLPDKPIDGNLDCPKGSCGEPNNFSIKTQTDIIVRKAEECNLQTEGLHYVFDLKNKELGVTAHCRIPTGYDQEVVAPLATINPVDASYTLLQRCLLRWNDKEVYPDHVDSLEPEILDWFDEAWAERIPGIQRFLPVTCWACGTEIPVAFQVTDFLFPKRTTN